MINPRRTKIICTLGPSIRNIDDIANAFRNGMNIARLNFSHGSYEELRELVTNIRKAAAVLQEDIPVIGDLCGPKIRTGNLGEDIFLEKDEKIYLATDDEPASFTNPKRIPVSHRNLHKDVEKGDTVLIDDGLIELVITGKDAKGVSCRVVEGGTVKSNKGVNFPASALSLPSLTAKDEEDIKFAIEHKLEFLALSFVRSSKDIQNLKKLLKSKGYNIPLIAKIEKPQAMEDIDAIIESSDVVMVARGDLGVEMNAYEVPILQKQIIRKCLHFNKPVITATQMLESMINNPRCTRAEANDVANAVFDGTDAVMLSGETSIGKYPQSAVKTMHSIVFRSEKTDYLKVDLFDNQLMIDNSKTAVDLSKAACRIAQDTNAALIIAMTKTGRTARYLAKYRIKTPILAFTPYKETLPILSITWGVAGILVDSFGVTEELLEQAKNYAIDNKWLKKDDFFVFVTGTPMLETNEINMIKIDKV